MENSIDSSLALRTLSRVCILLVYYFIHLSHVSMKCHFVDGADMPIGGKLVHSNMCTLSFDTTMHNVTVLIVSLSLSYTSLTYGPVDTFVDKDASLLLEKQW